MKPLALTMTGMHERSAELQTMRHSDTCAQRVVAAFLSYKGNAIGRPPEKTINRGI
jgi:hypothetical protein